MPRKSGWLSIDQASSIAQAQRIATVTAWKAFASGPQGKKLPVPVNPQLVYADSWSGWEVFFGVEFRVTKVMPAQQRSFLRARAYARALALSSPAQWLDFATSLECPPDLPVAVHRSYAHDGWNGYPDFLGYVPTTGSEKPFWSFAKARQYARGLGMSGSPGYRTWAVTIGRPPDMPMHPERTFAQDWRGWEDFLGKTHGTSSSGPARKTMPFELARFAVQDLGLATAVRYRQWALSRRRISGMPLRPDSAYRAEGWTGWSDFLGAAPTSSRSKARTLLVFNQARAIVRARGLSSGREYQETLVAERPSEFPVRPELAYSKTGWKGWDNFLREPVKRR